MHRIISRLWLRRSNISANPAMAWKAWEVFEAAEAAERTEELTRLLAGSPCVAVAGFTSMVIAEERIEVFTLNDW